MKQTPSSKKCHAAATDNSQEIMRIQQMWVFNSRPSDSQTAINHRSGSLSPPLPSLEQTTEGSIISDSAIYSKLGLQLMTVFWPWTYQHLNTVIWFWWTCGPSGTLLDFGTEREGEESTYKSHVHTILHNNSPIQGMRSYMFNMFHILLNCQSKSNTECVHGLVCPSIKRSISRPWFTCPCL